VRISSPRPETRYETARTWDFRAGDQRFAGYLISLETRHRGWAADERENVANTSVLFGSPTTSECN
jgi:hypothetical protein